MLLLDFLKILQNSRIILHANNFFIMIVFPYACYNLSRRVQNTPFSM